MGVSLHPPRTFRITLVCHPSKRFLPNGKIPLSPVHINGGVTSRSSNEAHSLVFRKEEMIKVMIHETIHAMRIPLCHTALDQNFEFLASEALVDALACEVYASYLESVFGFRNVRMVMQGHMKIQSDKVYTYLRYVNPHEHTSAFAYYVLKASIVTNADLMARLVFSLSDKDALVQLVKEACDRIAPVFYDSKGEDSLRMTPVFIEPYM